MKIVYLMLWAVFQIAAYVVGSTLMVKTVGRFLPIASGKLRRVSPYILFAITLSIPTWIGDANPLFLFLPFILVFLVCYDGVFVARLVTGMVFFELLIAWNMMVDSSREWMHNSPDSYDWISFLIKLGMWFLLFYLVDRRVPPDRPLQMSIRLWTLAGLLSAAPLFAELAFSIWGFQPYDIESLRSSFVGMVYTILLFAFLSSLALLYALTVLAQHETLQQEHQSTQLRELYYEGLKREQNQVHTLRHDLRNHLLVLQGLLERDEKEKTRNYLQELAQSPALCGGKRLCENEVANVVLNSKLETMREKDMTADFAVVLPKETGISDMDLCALLSNALDNAIEGTEKAEDQRILLRIRTDKGMLMMRLENAIRGVQISKNGQFETTKADQKRHGFGIPGMREIAQHYGGYLEAKVCNGRFELIVCLPCEKVGQKEAQG